MIDVNFLYLRSTLHPWTYTSNIVPHNRPIFYDFLEHLAPYFQTPNHYYYFVSLPLFVKIITQIVNI